MLMFFFIVNNLYHIIEVVDATHATRTFERPLTPHPTEPYNAERVENFVINMQLDAEQHSKILISTDDFNTPVSTGTYSDVKQHEISLNTYQVSEHIYIYIYNYVMY